MGRHCRNRERFPHSLNAAWRGGLRRRAAQSAAALLPAALFAALLLSSCSRSISAPSSVVATPNGTSIDLSWLPVAGASQYDIFLSTSPNVSTTSYTLETVTTDTSAVVTGLTIGSTYYVVVAAGSVYGFAVGPSSAVISVQLTGNPSSSAPVITAISASPSIASAGSLVLFAVSASDSDGDTLTYTWSVNGGTVAGPTANLNQYNWTASATTGTYTVGVQVSDGTTTVSASTTVTVQ